MIKSSIWIPNNKGSFNYLYESKDEIESDCDLNLIWERLDKSKASRIDLIKEQILILKIIGTKLLNGN